MEYVVSKDGVIVDSLKIKAAKNRIQPNFVTEIKCFVRLASNYWCFVKNFACIDTHLTKLTKKEIPFEQVEKCVENIQKIKILLTTAPILASPSEGKDSIVYCGAPHSGSGDMLMQDNKVIAYAS